jgi:hypothetical protein
MPQAASISTPLTATRTGMHAYWPTMAPPSRASQISGPAAGTFGLSRYCQSQRSLLELAMSDPNTRRYSASMARRSSGRYRSMSAIVTVLRPYAGASTHHVTDERVLRERSTSQRRSGRQAFDGGCDVQFLRDGEAGARSIAAGAR